MLAVTREKVARAGLAQLVDTAHLSIEDLATLRLPTLMDGILSNFGGLNCVKNLPGVANGLAGHLRPGGRALLCVMGPTVPWEWAWFLARGQPRKAMRRFRMGGAPWRGLTIQYPSIGDLRRAFARHFAYRRVTAVGALVPPTYAEAWASRYPRLLATLDKCERLTEAIPPMPWLADHYLIELERGSGRERP
jgi:hypothetical protein